MFTQNNIVHRDIKTANILIDRSGVVMIADFGLARSWTRDESMPPHLTTEYTNMVVTRWYRAPELLLGDTHYGPAVDMWSLGLVDRSTSKKKNQTKPSQLRAWRDL